LSNNKRLNTAFACYATDMKLHLNPTARIITTFVFSVLIISSPLLVNAQSIGNVQNLFALFLNVLNLYVVPIIFALAFVMFLVGVYRYFIAGAADEEKVKTGRNFVLWSLVGFFLMFSVWGLINLLVGSLQLASNNEPGLPQFNGAGTSAISSNPIASIFGGLLGGSNPTSTAGSTLAPGSIITDPATGNQYVVQNGGTYQTSTGSCVANYTLTGGTNTCNPNSSSNSNGSGSGAGSASGNGIVTCPDGSVASSYGNCQDLNAVTCPDGSVASSYGNCQDLNAVTCPDGSVASSYENCSDASMVTCPDGSVASSYGNCQDLNAVTCPDGSVASSYGNCQDLNAVTCPDGSVASSYDNCSTDGSDGN
jgi:hypothetical protein